MTRPGPVEESRIEARERERTESLRFAPGEVEGAGALLPLEDEPAAPPPRRRFGGGWALALGGVAATALAWIGVDIVGAVLALWDSSPLVAGLLGLLSAASGVALVGAVWREIAGLRRLHRVEAVRATLQAAVASGDGRRLQEGLAPLLKVVADRRPDLAKRFAEGPAPEEEEVAVRLARFERVVLRPMDAEARALVRRRALAAAVAAGVSPHPALDALVALFHALATARGLAQLYGLRPGLLVAPALLRRALVDALVAAGSERVVEAAGYELGEGLATDVSLRMSQGALVGWRGARLGLRLMEACRPLPLSRENRRSTLGLLGEALRPVLARGRGGSI